MNDVYYGEYVRFDTVSKKDAALLLGSDNLVGDFYHIEFHTENGQRTAWLRNRFGALIGFFSQETSRQLSIFEARGWVLHAVLAFIAYSENPDPGLFWGECALVCFDPDVSEAFEVFLSKIAERIAEGVRPDVDLGEQGVKKVLEHNGLWSPSRYAPLPPKESGTALLKSRRSLKEKVVEQARARNKGCYLTSFLFLLSAIAAIVFGLKSCGVF